MPRLPVISGSACIVALGKVGFRSVRQKGSHARLECSARPPVTEPLHSELDRGTLRSILRTAEISVYEFIRLLG